MAFVSPLPSSVNKRPKGGEVYHIGKRERKPIPAIVDDAARYEGSRWLYDWQMDFVIDMKISANLVAISMECDFFPGFQTLLTALKTPTILQPEEIYKSN